MSKNSCLIYFFGPKTVNPRVIGSCRSIVVAIVEISRVAVQTDGVNNKSGEKLFGGTFAGGDNRWQ